MLETTDANPEQPSSNVIQFGGLADQIIEDTNRADSEAAQAAALDSMIRMLDAAAEQGGVVGSNGTVYTREQLEDQLKLFAEALQGKGDGATLQNPLQAIPGSGGLREQFGQLLANSSIRGALPGRIEFCLSEEGIITGKLDDLKADLPPEVQTALWRYAIANPEDWPRLASPARLCQRGRDSPAVCRPIPTTSSCQKARPTAHRPEPEIGSRNVRPQAPPGLRIAG